MLFSSKATQYLQMSVCMSVQLSGVGENAIVSAANLIRSQDFSVQITLIYNHLIWEYIFRWSVGKATNDINVKILYNYWIFCYFLSHHDLFSFCDFYFQLSVFHMHIFLIISKILATYGCCPPCFVHFVQLGLWNKGLQYFVSYL